MGLGDMIHKSKSLKKAEKENTRRKLLTTECNSPYSALVREFLESAEMLDGAPSAASPLSVLDQKNKIYKACRPAWVFRRSIALCNDHTALGDDFSERLFDRRSIAD